MPRQGEVFWVDEGEPVGSEPGYRRPYVVIQNDRWNESPIRTVLVMAMTTNLRRARVPGNVLVTAADTGLSLDSVIVVSQVSTLDRDELTEIAGVVPRAAVRQAIAGLNLVLAPVR